MDDFSEFKYQTNLKEQLYCTLHHLASIATTEGAFSDVDAVRALLAEKFGPISEIVELQDFAAFVSESAGAPRRGRCAALATAIPRGCASARPLTAHALLWCPAADHRGDRIPRLPLQQTEAMPRGHRRSPRTLPAKACMTPTRRSRNVWLQLGCGSQPALRHCRCRRVLRC